MRHKMLLLGTLLTIVGLVGRYAIFTFVLDPNAAFVEPSPFPLPFYAVPISAITELLLLFSLPIAVVTEIVRWRMRVHHQPLASQ